MKDSEARSPSAAAPESRSTTGVILAGGRGSRMGGEDKGWVVLNGRPMVEYVVERLRPQVGDILISANRNQERYATLGCRVVGDAFPGFQGPLAGMASAIEAVATPFLVTVPCDSPLIGLDLVARLAGAMVREDADIAVVHDGERAHPVFLLLKRELSSSLAAFLRTGERKIDRWFGAHRVARADFSDCPEAFINVNDPDEQRVVEARLRRERTC